MAVYARQPVSPAALQALLPMADGVAQYIERKRTEEALRNSEERLRVLFEQMPGVLWTTDPELRFTSSWGTGLERLGLLPRQSVGPVADGILRDRRPRVTAHRGPPQGARRASRCLTSSSGWG